MHKKILLFIFAAAATLSASIVAAAGDRAACEERCEERYVECIDVSPGYMCDFSRKMCRQNCRTRP